MCNLASKQRVLNLELFENLLVRLIMTSLSTKYNHFQVNYNFQNKNWRLNEFISHCVQKEGEIEA